MSRPLAKLATVLVLVLGMTGVSAPKAMADRMYSVSDLGTGQFTSLNDQGQAVGTTPNNGRDPVSGLLYSDGKVTNFGTGFVPQGINNSGKMVGTATDGNSSSVVVRDAAGNTQRLGPISGAARLGINDSSQVVKSDYSETRIYSGNGQTVVTYGSNPSPAGSGSRAQVTLSAAGISDSGSITGTASHAGVPQQLFYAGSDGIAHLLYSFVIPQTTLGTAITPNGQILGLISGPGEGGYFIYAPDHDTLTKLPTDVLFRGINDSGLAIGRAQDRQTGISIGVVWDGHSVMDLNKLVPPASGIRIDDAIAINGSRQVLALGWTSGQTDGFEHTFLLTPQNPPRLCCSQQLWLRCDSSAERASERSVRRADRSIILDGL